MGYTSAKDSMVYCCRASDGELWGSFDGHNGAVFGFDITFDGKIMVTASADGTVRFWEALTGECFYVLDHGGICKFDDGRRGEVRPGPPRRDHGFAVHRRSHDDVD